MRDGIKTLLGELKAGLEALYGERLEGLYLYGSYARGEEDSESDLDVLIVLDCIEHYAGEVDRTSFLISDLSLKYRVSISCVFTTQHDWQGRDMPFLANVREEAIPA